MTTTNSKTKIRFLCYSDIHHHEYTNGITGDDVVDIENQFCRLVEELDVDFWCFLGDRFVSRNPLDISKFKADSALKRLNDTGKPGFMIPGNHCQYFKSASRGHSLQHISSIYADALPNIHILDKRKSYKYMIGTTLTGFHVIPAGFETDKTEFVIKDCTWNIILYHGMIKGSSYVNGQLAEDGTDTLDLDLPVDIVVCGDNHKFQKLNGFKNTEAWYDGAPMQHNWGDAGDDRGFALVTLEKDKKPIVEHILTNHPKFIKASLDVTSEQQLLEYCVSNTNNWVNNIIRINIRCTPEVMSTIDIQQIKNKMMSSGVRTFDIKPEMTRTALFEAGQTIPPDSQQWIDYLMTHADEIKSLDIELIKSIGMKYINEYSD